MQADDLTVIANNYQPDQRAVEAVRAADILLLVGISGAGKDTIQSKLLTLPGYHKIVTHTTRAPRANDGVMEQDGREYHFVSYDQMYQLLDTHGMIEVNRFGSNYYGTSVQEFIDASQSGSVAVGNIDVNGITSFRALSDQVRALFILPPDYETWRERLARRYQTSAEFDQEFIQRSQTAIDELEHVLSVPYYHFIINDDLERAVRVVDEIAHRKDSFNQHDDEARLQARALLADIKQAASI